MTTNYIGALPVTAMAFLVAACSDTAPARAQLVLVVDTDAPVVGQLASRTDLSEDAAVDTLRVDLLDAKNVPRELRTFIVPEPESWPVSFGLLPDAAGDGVARVRIRIFRGRLAQPGSQGGLATEDPPPEVTLDRFVRVSMPQGGVTTLRVFVTEACMGTSSSFVPGKESTCLDAQHLAAPPDQGTESGSEAASSQVGTWIPARVARCTLTPTSTQRCIPGGFSILGDRTVVGVANSYSFDAAPLHPVIVSPFLIDEFEFTVARFKALLAARTFDQPLPISGGDCTWNGGDDKRPLNCVTWAAASRACELEGGSLPTEAEWERAARGRSGLNFPWGSADIMCCATSIGRSSASGTGAGLCPGLGIEDVGSHPKAASCGGGLGDVTIDGVYDMAGSVSEATADLFARYDSPCWTISAILRNPRCSSEPTTQHAARGGSWGDGIAWAQLVRRPEFSENDSSMGFRCRYPGDAQ